MILLWIGLGGALGSVLRFWIQTKFVDWSVTGFPYATLCINVAGSFLMGFLFWKFSEQWPVSSSIREGILVGCLGGFTTFSTFSNDTLQLLISDQFMKAGLYVFFSLLLCIVFAGIGLYLAKNL